MGICDFPRIHFKGLLEINVGTANNDDYSADTFPPGSPFAGQPLRLADSVTVQPNRFDMDDEAWVRWAQAPHDFVKPTPAAKPSDTEATRERPPVPLDRVTRGQRIPADLAAASNTTRLIPVEWNYYGDMGLTMKDVTVLSVQTPEGVVTDPAVEPFVGATLSFNNRPGRTGRTTGMLIDVNPESVPCSQIFADALTLEKDGEALMTGRPSKACTRWVNFQRNTRLHGPNGAGGTFYCTVPLDAIAGQPVAKLMQRVPAPAGKVLAGVQVRYVLYRAFQPINVYKFDAPGEWNREMVALYARKGMNPDVGEIQGTIGPWYEDELASSPTGRILDPTGRTFALPDGSDGNGKQFRLAPAQVHVGKARVSIDCATTFPDSYSREGFDPYVTGDDPKFDLGAVHLVLRDAASGAQHDFGALPYTDTAAGDRRGWVFDFSTDGVSDELIANGEFGLHSPVHGDLLVESEYLIASDQSCLFAEQGAAGATTDRFMDDGPAETPATVRVFRKGRELTGADCPKISMWSYDTTPNQIPGTRELLDAAMSPGDPIAVAVCRAGNRLLTFTVEGQGEPPATSDSLDLMVIPQVNLRILPNDKDYSGYYVDPGAAELVGNERLTFDVIYDEVLRNYYLLYPGMNLRVPLNDPEQWAGAEMAGRLMQRTQKSWFATAKYMPRTRDLSDSRRTLLHAWCRKFFVAEAQGGQS